MAHEEYQKRVELQQQIAAKLAAAKIPSESIKVFGVVRLNVHVTCLGRDTADRWARLLAGAFSAKVFVGEHSWNAVENRGLQLCPTKRNGYLVAVAS